LTYPLTVNAITSHRGNARDGAQPRSSLEARLVDAVQQAVIATDLDGRVLVCLYTSRLFGWTEQEALGRSIVELTPHSSSARRATRWTPSPRTRTHAP
jgi:PAS domain-containing protein